MQEKPMLRKENFLLVFFIMFVIAFVTNTKSEAKEFDGAAYNQTIADLVDFAASSTEADSEIILTDDIVILHEVPAVGNALYIGRDLSIDLNGKTLKIQTTVPDSNGIKIANNCTLTILDSNPSGSGRLESIYEKKGFKLPGYGYGAGINTTNGTLLIRNGTISALSNSEGAGIGGGKNSSGGIVTIRNGTVTAESVFGAGIGGGMNASGGTVTIYDGLIFASSTDGAGIGGGASGNSGGILYIGNGTITAESYAGAGIGGGINGSGGVLNMEGGTVTVKSSKSAGIGGNGKSTGIGKISGGNLIRSGAPGSSKWETSLRDDSGMPVYPIEIKVLSTSDGKPVNQTTISVISSIYTAFTNTDGYACIWLPDIPYVINFSRPGYLIMNQNFDRSTIYNEIQNIFFSESQLPKIDGNTGESYDFISLPSDYTNFSKTYSFTGNPAPTVIISEDRSFTKSKISQSGLFQIPDNLPGGRHIVKIKASNGALPDAVMTIQIDIPHPANDFVIRLYDGIFMREPDTDGHAFWYTGLITREISGAHAANFFFTSPEMISLNLSDTEYIERLYTVMMGRSSDAEGLAFWMNILSKGEPRENIIDYFSSSEEFTNIVLSFSL